MKISSKGYAKKLDKLFRLVIRHRDNWTCQKCGKEFPEEYSKDGWRKARGLDTAHFKGRRLYATRWDLSNSIALCCGCHNEYGHTTFMDDAIQLHFGNEEYERICATHNNPPQWKKHMYQEKYDELMIYAKEIGAV